MVGERGEADGRLKVAYDGCLFGEVAMFQIVQRVCNEVPKELRSGGGYFFS